MNQALRQAVRRRANHRCEYCHIKETHLPFAAFHLDHIVAKQHGGSDDLENLAWSCHECNLNKGPNLTSIDPDSGEVVRLFDPRKQSWDEHFSVEKEFIRARTNYGRATIWLLQLNSSERMELRSALAAVGEW
jgi:hypothetical protein